MFHGVSALTLRGLRDEARRPCSHYLRLAAVVAILVFVIGSALMGLGGRLAFGPGLMIFGGLVVVDAALLLLASAAWFGSIVTEEREDGTLGLLKLASISPPAFLLGKLTPRVIKPLLVLLAQLPMAFLALVLGGVTLHQVAAALVSLASLLVFCAGLGFLVSLISPRTVTASGIVILLWTLWLGAAPALGTGGTGPGAGNLPGWPALQRTAASLQGISIPAHLWDVIRPGYQGPVMSQADAFGLVAGAACLLLSLVLFPLLTRKVQPPEPIRWRINWRTRRKSKARAWRVALVWKEFYFRLNGWLGCILILLLNAGLLWLIERNQSAVTNLTGWRPRDAALWGFCLVAGVLMAQLTVSTFATEHRHRTLSVLMLIPRSPLGISYEKVTGVVPAMICCILPAVVLTLLGRNVFNWPMMAQPNWWIGVILYLVAVHAAVLFSLRYRVGGWAIGLGVVVTLLLVLGPVLGMFVMHLRRMGHPPSATIAPLLYIGGAIVVGEQAMILRQLRRSAAAD